jgi:hypothetical protein
MGKQSRKQQTLPVFLWIVYLVVSILLTIIVMYIVKKIEAWICGKKKDDNSPSVLDSPVICILVDIIIYLFLGMFVNLNWYPLWAVTLFAILYEVITQCFLTYCFREFYNATWIKSVVDIICIVGAFWVGSALQRRVFKRGYLHGKENACFKLR